MLQWRPFRSEGTKNSANLRAVAQFTRKIVRNGRGSDLVTQEVFSKPLPLI